MNFAKSTVVFIFISLIALSMVLAADLVIDGAIDGEDKEEDKGMTVKSNSINPVTGYKTGNLEILSQDGIDEYYTVSFEKFSDTLTKISYCINEDDVNASKEDFPEYSVPPLLSYTLDTKDSPTLTSSNPVIEEVKMFSTKKDFCSYFFINPYDLEILKLGDNSTYIVPEINLYVDAVTNNITVEANFSHLAIRTEYPYSNLIFYYNFDVENTSFNRTYDYSTNNLNGRILNTNVSFPESGDDHWSGGTYHTNFTTGNGNAAQVTASYLFNATATSNFTWCAWVKPNVANTGTMTFLSTQRSGFPGVNMHRGSDERYAWSLRNNTGGAIALSDTAVALNTTWSHVCARYNTTNLSLYINGTFKAATAMRGTLLNAATSPLCIGSQSGGSSCALSGAWNGSIDEVMGFNVSLTPPEILEIYENTSARFSNTGTFNLTNQSYLNITSGDNRLNVSTNFNNYFDTNISLSVGYYDGTWSNTAPQNLTSPVNTFTITSGTTNLTLNFTFFSTTNTAFYTPNLISNITLETWTEGGGGGGTCVYVSGDWTISDGSVCNVTTVINLNGNELRIMNGIVRVSGAGRVIANGIIINQTTNTGYSEKP